MNDITMNCNEAILSTKRCAYLSILCILILGGGCVRTSSSPPRALLVPNYDLRSRATAVDWKPVGSGEFEFGVIGLRVFKCGGVCIDVAMRSDRAHVDDLMSLATMWNDHYGLSESVYLYRDAVFCPLRAPIRGDDYIPHRTLFTLNLGGPLSMETLRAPQFIIESEPATIVLVIRGRIQNENTLPLGEYEVVFPVAYFRLVDILDQFADLRYRVSAELGDTVNTIIVRNNHEFLEDGSFFRQR